MAYYKITQTSTELQDILDSVADKADAIKEVTVVGETLSVAQPNTFYIFGQVSSLTVSSFATKQGIVNEYMFQFTPTADNITITLPANIKWTETPILHNGLTYQVSIMNNLGIITEWPYE